MSNTNLDDLFKDKFSDFKEMPDEKVWRSIEASLNKRKNKRILPLWWQLGGIAAAIAIAAILLLPLGSNQNPEIKVTNVETPVPKEQKGADGQLPTTEQKEPLPQGTENAIPEKGSRTEEATTGVASVDQTGHPKENTKYSGASEHATTELDKAGAAVAGRTNDTQERNPAAIAPAQETAKDPLVPMSPQNRETHLAQTPPALTSHKEGHAQRTANEVISENSLENGMAQERAEDASLKKEEKSLFEVLDTETEKDLAQRATNKWSAGPSIAPVYFNGLGQGSPIDPTFEANSRSGNINLSYGISVAYALSKKWSVRSGVHKVNYGYDTNEVAFSSSLTATSNGQFANVDYASSSMSLVLTGKNTNTSIKEAAAKDAFTTDLAKVGVMNQRMGYLEVPLEFNYALLDNAFGLDLIGGFSSLFLTDNDIALASGDLTTQMGKANNINSLNFSTNIGVGIKYRLAQRLQLRLEPMFKYQLNTFTNTGGAFRPYSVGVYSGLNFRF